MTRQPRNSVNGKAVHRFEVLQITERQGRRTGITCQEWHSKQGFETMEATWRKLYADCSHPTPFARWEWLSAWRDHFARDPTYCFLFVAIYDACEELIGLLPFYSCLRGTPPFRVREMRLLGDPGPIEGMTEEPIVLFRRGREREATERLMTHLISNAVTPWDYVYLRLPLNGYEVHSEPLQKFRLDSMIDRREALETEVLMLPDKWQDFRRSLHKSMRDNLAYYPRLLDRHGHKWQIKQIQDPERIAQAVDSLVELHRLRAESSGYPHWNHISTPVHRAFIRQSLPALAARGSASVWMMEVDGKEVAAQAVLEDRDNITVYYSGFDPSFGKYSPVTILLCQVFKDAIERGILRVNFLHGGAPWKSRWGTKPHPLYQRIRKVRPHPLSLLRALIYSYRRKTE